MREASEEAMNVSCPQCATAFRVDPAKVPERGVRARVSVCGGLIAVRRPVGSSAPAAAAVAAPPAAPVASQAPNRVAAPVASPPPPPAAPVVPPPQAVPTPPVVPQAAPAAPPPPPPPPAVASPVVPVAVLPAVPTPAPQPVAPPAAEAASAGSGRYTNPFLQQDPATRARRLARALVSDLVVYHPEKRQRGLVEGNLKDLFAEEIRKSWEEYTEQVGEELANSTPYFTEALNEILAEGNRIFG